MIVESSQKSPGVREEREPSTLEHTLKTMLQALLLLNIHLEAMKEELQAIVREHDRK